VQVIELGILFRTSRNGGPSEYSRLAVRVRAAADVADLGTLYVHAADEHGIGPLEIIGRRRPYVFVAKADLPSLGKCGRHHEKSLRWHEGAHAV
jgi:hypothetical protein